MNTEIKVPELPESIADATVANWYKEVGDTIAADEVLVDLETDKVILEVPAVKAGVLKEIKFSVGDRVTSGQLLAVVDESSSAIVSGGGVSDSSSTNAVSDNNLTAAMSPSVRKLIAENSIDETQLKGTGKNGRILKQDVESYLVSDSSGQKKAEVK